jgi:signal transduction histidine kinase
VSRLLEEVVAYVALGDDDRARLVDLHARLAPAFPAIADRFYEVVAAHPATARLVTRAQLARMREALIEWMASGLVGPYDAAFVERRSRIGRRHVAVGLPQHYVLTAMTVIRDAYDDRIAALYAPDEARRVARSVNKLLDVELALMLGHYQVDAEDRLVERERRIQSERVAAMQTMSAGLAHEVRNPLNSAKLQLELLERRLRREHNDPKLVEPVELAHHEIERLTRLLNEFLAFARPPDLDLVAHDIIALAHTVIAAERPLADRRGATISLTSDEPVTATVDPGKLQQILQNLIRNAIEAVEPGGLITVAIRGDAGHLYLAVSDDGPGIPDAICSRIYEPFFSTKDGGTGLGMSIVHSMVTLHGGTIDVDSSPCGTRFEVVMPRAASSLLRDRLSV